MSARRPNRIPPGPLLLVLTVAGCGIDDTPGGEPPIPVPVPELRPADGVLEEATLLEVVDRQIARDGEGLRAYLAAPDATVRARAAFAAASVQDETLAPDLAALLGDPVPAVRRDAAFALGQIPLPDEGRGLLEALVTEEDAGVRGRLLEAVGKVGGSAVAEGLLDWTPPESDLEAYYLALARLGVRAEGAPGGPVVEALAGALAHPSPGVRWGAAYFFGRAVDPEPWQALAPWVREALDAAEPSDPIAMELLIALGRLRDRADVDRFMHWLRNAEDWRSRARAAAAVGTIQNIEAPGVRDALWRAMVEDPSEHVAIVAAESLNSGFRVPLHILDAGREWIEGEPARWRTHLAFVRSLAQVGEDDAVIAWIRHVASAEPLAAARGLQIAVQGGHPELTDLLFELVESPDARLQGMAVAGLRERWMMTVRQDEDLEEFFHVFAERVRRGANLPAREAARALTHPAFHQFGAMAVLEEAFHARDEVDDDGDLPARLAILEAMGEAGDPVAMPLIERELASPDLRRRQAAGRAHRMLTGQEPRDRGIPEAGLGLAPEALRALGPAPVLVLETEKGELAVRLVPEQAPLTVQTVAELAAGGQYDGVAFHRVLPNFVVQAGDFTMGDGTGGPGWSIRSEFTQIPFGRGVIGMASSGKDTEGSQFFLTHSRQPHLDGGWTAFGFVVSGEDVLDRILEGDRIVRARVEPGAASDPQVAREPTPPPSP